MALAELQAAMARLYVDPVLRDRFFTDPAAVGAELGLDLEEALGLARTPRRQVDQFADSLLRKRRSQVRRVVPNAARAMGSRFIEHFDRYTRSRHRGDRRPISTTRPGSWTRSVAGPIRSNRHGPSTWPDTSWPGVRPCSGAECRWCGCFASTSQGWRPAGSRNRSRPGRPGSSGGDRPRGEHSVISSSHCRDGDTDAGRIGAVPNAVRRSSTVLTTSVTPHDLPARSVL